MALMTDDIQEKLIKLLVDEGLVSRGVIDRATKQSAKTNKPLLTLHQSIFDLTSGTMAIVGNIQITTNIKKFR